MHIVDHNPDRVSPSKIAQPIETASAVDSNLFGLNGYMQLDLSSIQFPSSSDQDVSPVLASRPERPRTIVPSGQTQTTTSSPASVRSRVAPPISPIIFATPASSQHSSHSLLYDATYGDYESPSSPPTSSQTMSGHGPRIKNEKIVPNWSSSEAVALETMSGVTMLTPLTLSNLQAETNDVDLRAGADPLSTPWTLSPISLAPSSSLSVDISSGKAQFSSLFQVPVISPNTSFRAPEPIIHMPIVPTTSLSSPTSHLSSLPASTAAGLDIFNEDASDMSAREYAAAIMSTAWGARSDNQLVSTVGCFERDPAAAPFHEFGGKGCPQCGAEVERQSKAPTKTTVVGKLKRFGSRVKTLLKGHRAEKRRGAWSASATLDAEIEAHSDHSGVAFSFSPGILVSVNPLLTNAATNRSQPPAQRDWRIQAPRSPQGAHLSSHIPHPESVAPVVTGHLPFRSASKGKGKDHLSRLVEGLEIRTPSKTHPPVPTQVKSGAFRRLSFSPFSHSTTQPIPARARPRSSLVSTTRLTPIDTHSRTGLKPTTVEIDGFLKGFPNSRMGRVPNAGGTHGPPGLSVSSSLSATTPRGSGSPSATPTEVAKRKNHRFSLSALSSFGR